jgi:hypothetical protein
VPAHASRTVWFTVAGSDQGLAEAQAQFQAASADPAAELAAKITARQLVDSRTQVSLPGDPTLAQSVTWSKQDLADLTQQADNLQIRDTEQGTVYPPPLATVPSIRFEGAGFPDYPWMFATDQEYTVFALLAAGQFATAEDGLRSLAQVSEIANQDSGKVVHETVTDGSVYFGLNDEPGDIDETAKFPDAVAMVWRWTGDNTFRDQMYGFVQKNLQYLIGLANGDDDLWPDGSGNKEAPGLGPDAVDVAVYTIRGLYDLADMAASKGDTATQQWADSNAAAMEQKFSADWPAAAIHRRSGPAATRRRRRAARRDAGDRTFAGLSRQHRPSIQRAVLAEPGVGNLRRAVAGSPPAARGGPSARRRPARGAAGRAARPVVGQRDQHQGRDRLGRRHRHPPRELLYHDGHRPPDVHPARRRHPPCRRPDPPSDAQRKPGRLHSPRHQRGPPGVRVHTMQRPDPECPHRRRLTATASPQNVAERGGGETTGRPG